MKIAIFGAGGTIGSRIAVEAQRRGHLVTAIVRDLARTPPGLTGVEGDILDPASVAQSVANHDAVISAIGPSLRSAGEGGSVTSDLRRYPQIVKELLVQAAVSLLAGLKKAGVQRVAVVGGAGSLEVKPGLQLVDTPDFPQSWKALALAHRDALDVFKAETAIDWIYVSPAAFIEPGERTGKYRLGFDQLLIDSQGSSSISVEDYAVALLDELESGAHIRRRVSVAY